MDLHLGGGGMRGAGRPAFSGAEGPRAVNHRLFDVNTPEREVLVTVLVSKTAADHADIGRAWREVIALVGLPRPS